MSVACEGEFRKGIALCPNGQRVLGIGSTFHLCDALSAYHDVPLIERVSDKVYLDLANVVAMFAEIAVKGSPPVENLRPYLQADSICVDMEGLIVEQDNLVLAPCRQFDETGAAERCLEVVAEVYHFGIL
jgi:hypothetical protein